MPLPLFLGFQRREDAILLISVVLRLGGICVLAGSLVSLLMLRSSIHVKMHVGSLLPPNFQSAISHPECLGGRVGCRGDVGDPVGGSTLVLAYIHPEIWMMENGV